MGGTEFGWRNFVNSLGDLDAIAVEVIRESDAHLLLEQLAQIDGMDVVDMTERLKRQLRFVTGMDILYDFANDRTSALFRRGNGVKRLACKLLNILFDLVYAP